VTPSFGFGDAVESTLRAADPANGAALERATIRIPLVDLLSRRSGPGFAMMRRLLLTAFACALVMGCSSTSTTYKTERPNASESSSSDTPQNSEPTEPDETTEPAKNRMVPAPPPGATKCGGAEFAHNDAIIQCDGTGIQGVPHACRMVEMTTGSTEVWCSDTTVYVWMIFRGLRAGELACSDIELTAYYHDVSSEGLIADAPKDEAAGFATSPSAMIEGGNAVDMAIWKTVKKTPLPYEGSSWGASFYVGARAVAAVCPQQPDEMSTVLGMPAGGH
jgi:hypothetical protein